MTLSGKQRLDLDHYRRFPFLPDPAERIDRWFQTADGRTAKEVRYLIGIARTLMRDRPELVVDPMCGAGSAAVAARLEGLAFRGFERYPPRALFALAKSRATGDATGDWTPELSLEACRVARSELSAEVSVEQRLRWIADDASELAAPSDLDVRCLDIRDGGLPVLGDDRPAILLTSPPHPQTRGVFKDHSDPAVQRSIRVLRQLNRFNGGPVHSPIGSSLISALFSFVVARFPALQAAVVEFEDPPGYPFGAAPIVAAAAEHAFAHVETIITYRGAPDGQHGGSGGLVLLRRR